MKTAIPALIVPLASALVLTGCSGVKENLGLARTSPDEFAVVKRAPLEMPQDLSTLPPPRPGVLRPQEKSPEIEARETIFGQTALEERSGTSAGEAAILGKAGAGNVPDNVRVELDREAAELAESERSVADKLLNWSGGGGRASANVVDAAKEAARLKNNLESGRPVTEGKTPTIKD